MHRARPASRATPGFLGAAGAVLLVVGLVCAGLYRLESGSEHHAFSGSGVAPSSARLVGGTQYELSYPGGITELDRRHLSVETLSCTWALSGSAAQALAISDSGYGDKPTNEIATFEAPATGDTTITCDGLGTMYVDDAENAGGDPAGWYLVLTMVLLSVGAALALSALRSVTLRPRPLPTASP